MATERSVWDESFISGADLSAHQWRIAYLSGARTVTFATGVTIKSIGIIQDNVDAAGKAVNVRVLGISKVVAGEAMATPGTEVTSDAAGKAVAAATTDFVVGRTLEASAADGDIISILVLPTGSKV